MKYTRIEMKSKFSKYKVIIYFSILLPISALLIGKILINYSESQVTSIAMKLDDFNSVYLLQLGVFEKEEGAKSKLNGLKAKDIEAVILKDGNYYKVVSNVASSPKKLEGKVDSYKKRGITTYIKDFPVEGVESIKDGNIKEYKACIKEFILATLDRKESVMKSSYNNIRKMKKVKVDNTKIKSKIEELCGKVIEVYSTNESINYTKNILEIIVNYNSLS